MSSTSATLPPPLPPARLAPATWGWLAALLGWTIILCFYHLDGGAGFEMTDCWVAQTAREMRDATSPRDLLIPVFSSETRMQKSPGPYWAVILAAEARGRPIDEAAARIPSGIAALVLVLTVFWLTWHIAGDRSAVFAGFATSASALVLYWSHRAASDLGLATLVTLSLAAFWVAFNRHPPGWRRAGLILLAYFAAGLGMLYKLPMPLVLVGFPAFLYVLLRNRWGLLWSRWHLVGLVAFALPWLPWAIAILQLEPTAWDKWRTEYFDRFTGDLPNIAEQRGQWLLYLMYLAVPVVYCLPFSLSLPQAFARVFRPPAGANRDGLHFMLIWFAAMLAFFLAAAGKELRYFLPALPPLFVLLGIELARFFDPAREVPARRLLAGVWAARLLLPGGFLAGALGLRKWHAVNSHWEWHQVWQPYAVMAVLFVAGTLLAVELFRRGRRNAAFAALVGAMYVTWLWAWPNVLPVLAAQAEARDFAEQLRTGLTTNQKSLLRQIANQDSRVIWYSDVRFPRIVDQLELLRQQGGQRSLEREIELVGEALVDALSGDQPILLVAARADYVRFLRDAPARLAAAGRTMPQTFLWLQSRIGSKSRQHVLFGNIPPPWPEPPLTPPSHELEAARRGPALSPASRAAESRPSRPASRPG